jgi:RNA polymerase sigma-70 factor (TIGR02960 family)
MAGVAPPTPGPSDEEVFRDLVEPLRSELHLHCYRMMGSLADAEDVLQETMLAAWRGLDGFEGRSSARTWLHRIATNRCLNALRSARRREPAEPVPPFDPPQPSRSADARWIQPLPQALLQDAATGADPAERAVARETVELAFVTALQTLPPRQVAALLLCDVLGHSTTHAAQLLDTTPTAVKGVLHRARAGVTRRADQRGGVHRPADSRAEQALARRFADAFDRDDVDALVDLLTDDAWLAMPPAPHEYVGPAAIRSFWEASAAGRRGRQLHSVPTRANRQPALGCYLDASRGEPATFDGIVVLTMRGTRVSGVTRFLDPTLSGPFDLPELWRPSPAHGPPAGPDRA